MLLLPAYAQTITEDMAQIFSDTYKSDYGVRPYLPDWDRQSMVAWFDNRSTYEDEDYEWLDYASELAREYQTEQDYTIHEHYARLAPSHVEGWE